MIQALRRKLTILFLTLFLTIYGVGGGAALLVFFSGLSTALYEEIDDLSSEIMPAITLTPTTPSLKTWAAAATKEKLKYPAGIQIFDKDKNLLESYGLSGKDLRTGEFTLQVNGKPIGLISKFEKLKFENKLIGYLQIQMATETRDEAVWHFGFAMLLILPFLAVLVTFAGYFFSGLAIKPVEKSLQVLKTFVADAGHEFNTPISIVEASLDTLEEILTENGIGLEILHIIGRASNTMKELSNDLIYLAKIDNPGADLSKELISIQDIVIPPIEGVMELARTKQIELTHSSIPDVKIRGNLYSLRMMISNLLTNALKYTDAGGTVNVKVNQDGNRVLISVEDSGIGIPQSSLDHIFDRFYRVDESRNRAAGGSGLGLAIVKAVLERHQADIDVRSTPGKGSTFTVRMHRA